MNTPTTHVASYDLHLHSYWSYDATANPRAYFQHAAEKGMRCLAITEHHQTDSLAEVLAIANRFRSIRVIPAAELTVHTSIGAVDLLCYQLPVTATRAWQKLLDAYHAWQCEYGEALCRGMQALGLDYTRVHRMELLQSYRPDRVIGSQGCTHVKNGVQRDYFLKRGFIQDETQYRPLLDRAGAAVSRPLYPAVEMVTAVVKEVGGLIAIAHPLQYFEKDNRQRMDALRQECRLDGVECAHPGVAVELTPVYRQYCVEHGMFSTAGSDVHDEADIEQWMGRHGGAEEWLEGFLERLQ